MIASPLNLLSDQELISHFQAGDAAAFNEIMLRHKEKAVQLAWVKCGNWEDAKDIAQEAFVKAYHALPNFRGESKFSTWLYTLIMNTARDYWRKKHPLRWLTWSDQREMDFFFESQVNPAGHPSETAASTENAERIAQIAGSLPERQRLIFTLRFFQEAALSEIAQILGISEGAVKASLHFALQKFKAAYIQQDQPRRSPL